MDYDENGTRASGLRPPSRIPASAIGRSLYEVSESDNNVRSTATSIPQPHTMLKHKPTNLPEPPTKRKTLVERAEETRAMQQSSLAMSTNGKMSNISGYRNPSSSSTASSRYTSGSTRATSAFSSSIGRGAKPPSNGNTYRPQSALSYTTKGQKPLTQRPESSIDIYTPAPDSEPGKRQGMAKISSTPTPTGSCLPVQKQRRRAVIAKVASREHCGLSKGLTKLSINNGLQDLSLQSQQVPSEQGQKRPHEMPVAPLTPSHIPRPRVPQSATTATSATLATPRSMTRRPRNSISPNKPLPFMFLTKESNTKTAWDTQGRLEDMEEMYRNIKQQIETSTSEKTNLQQHIDVYRTRITELESIRSQLTSTNGNLQAQNDSLKMDLSSARTDLENLRRNHNIDVDDLNRRHRNEMDEIRDQLRKGSDKSKRDAQEEVEQLIKKHRDDLELLEKRLKSEIEEERGRRLREVQDVQTQWALQRQNAKLEAGNQDREIQKTKHELNQVNASLESEQTLKASLKTKLAESSLQIAELESSMEAMKAKVTFLESDSHAQSHAFADLNRRMQEAIDSAKEANSKLRTEETLRRKLHNQVQELKGNIRVFCRVRPLLGAEEEEAAKISFPDATEDAKEVMVLGPETKSALGNVSSTKNGFSFDRVFSPSAKNADVFEEISQLVQSALDGYNVCIFCYGQTGSGKTHTMSSADGMIPLATDQIYSTAKSLEDKGWSYTMEGSFVEVYNENLNDLLGSADDLDKKKLQIVHDNDKCRTTITDVTTVRLDSPDTVATMLSRASSNRSVAATKANERSSRSHSVFILKLLGENSVSGERSEGTLNLVDLAGSERLAHSGATGDRLKETQNINKSLSSLGDVIGALGQGKQGAHIPYRNSKLTYLLQHSLGGNSKTLMFVMISPMMAHLGETLTSLKFATKVHNTHIGTAKRQTKVSSS